MEIKNITIKSEKNKNWKQTIKSSSPDTYDDSSIYKVEDLYPKEKVEERELVLINYSKDGNWKKALEYAKENDLEFTTPKDILALQKQYPELNKDSDVENMYVVETTGCSFGGDALACYVSWDGVERKSGLYWRGDFGDGGDWFAFRKSSKLKSSELKETLPFELNINGEKYRKVL
jgi:hypothetical protein